VFVLLLRGMSNGESTARLARELQRSRQTVHTCRQQIQANLNERAPTELMEGTTFEVDALYQNAGGKRRHAVRPERSAPLKRCFTRKTLALF
jgi:hypothetical protein